MSKSEQPAQVGSNDVLGVLVEKTHISCLSCGAENALPTGDDCTSCGKSLGMFRRLVAMVVSAEGQPRAHWERALSSDEVAAFSREPWKLLQIGKTRVWTPNVRAKLPAEEGFAGARRDDEQ